MNGQGACDYVKGHTWVNCSCSVNLHGVDTIIGVHGEDY